MIIQIFNAYESTYNGGGHTWVIDGFATPVACTMNEVTGELIPFGEHFVHCNWGWDGRQDGYFISLLMEKYMHFDIPEESAYFDKGIQLLVNVKSWL